MVIGTSVSNTPVATTPTYCTVADVYRYLREALPGSTADEGDLSQPMVKDLILEKEAEVDRACGTSWRARRVALEYHDYDTWISSGSWLVIQTRHKPVMTLAVASGDGFELWNGSTWEDWLANKTQGRASDWWLEEPTGNLYMRRSILLGDRDARVKLSYRYGNSAVPADIKSATAMLVAAELASGDLVSYGGSGTSAGGLGIDPKVRRWERRAYSILASHQHYGGA